MDTKELTIKSWEYHIGGSRFVGKQVSPTAARGPAVLVAHDWSGCNDFALESAKRLAGLGYHAFCADLYGDGRVATAVEEKNSLLTELITDRHLVKTRMQGALAEMTRFDHVDPGKVAAVGFCMGGLCSLDLARSGSELAAVVSFHGLLGPANFPTEDIKASILVLHGYDDPLAPPEQLSAFFQEMTATGCDWQAHCYGSTAHAFTNPAAQDKDSGLYFHEQAAQRSWQAAANFLAEKLQPVPPA